MVQNAKRRDLEPPHLAIPVGVAIALALPQLARPRLPLIVRDHRQVDESRSGRGRVAVPEGNAPLPTRGSAIAARRRPVDDIFRRSPRRRRRARPVLVVVVANGGLLAVHRRQAPAGVGSLERAGAPSWQRRHAYLAVVEVVAPERAPAPLRRQRLARRRVHGVKVVPRPARAVAAQEPSRAHLQDAVLDRRHGGPVVGDGEVRRGRGGGVREAAAGRRGGPVPGGGEIDRPDLEDVLAVGGQALAPDEFALPPRVLSVEQVLTAAVRARGLPQLRLCGRRGGGGGGGADALGTGLAGRGRLPGAPVEEGPRVAMHDPVGWVVAIVGLVARREQVGRLRSPPGPLLPVVPDGEGLGARGAPLPPVVVGVIFAARCIVDGRRDNSGIASVLAVIFDDGGLLIICTYYYYIDLNLLNFCGSSFGGGLLYVVNLSVDVTWDFNIKGGPV